METLVQIAKILSDINRVKIIALMHREKELCVCEICDTLQLSQPLVSRHLKLMREAEIVKTRQSGKWIIYRLHQNRVVERFLKEFEDAVKTLPQVISCKKL